MGFIKLATLSALLWSSLAWAAPIEDNTVVEATSTPVSTSNIAASAEPTSTAIAPFSAALASALASLFEHGPRASGYPHATAVHPVPTPTPTDLNSSWPISDYPLGSELYYDQLMAQYEIALMGAQVLELEYAGTIDILRYEDKNATALYKELNYRLEEMRRYQHMLEYIRESDECTDRPSKIHCSYCKPYYKSDRCVEEIKRFEGLILEQKNLVADDVKLWTQWLENAQSNEDVKKVLAKSDAIKAAMKRIEKILTDAGKEVPGKEEDATSAPTDTTVLTAELEATPPTLTVLPIGHREYAIPPTIDTPEELEAFLSNTTTHRDVINRQSQTASDILQGFAQQLDAADKASRVARHTFHAIEKRLKVLGDFCYEGSGFRKDEAEWHCHPALRELEAEYEKAETDVEASEARIKALGEAYDGAYLRNWKVERELGDLNDFIVKVKEVLKEAKAKAAVTSTEGAGYAAPTPTTTEAPEYAAPTAEPVSTSAAEPTHESVVKRDHLNTGDREWTIPPRIKSAADLETYLQTEVQDLHRLAKLDVTYSQQDLEKAQRKHLIVVQEIERLEQWREDLEQQLIGAKFACHDTFIHEPNGHLTSHEEECNRQIQRLQIGYDGTDGQLERLAKQLEEVEVLVQEESEYYDRSVRVLSNIEAFVAHVEDKLEKAKTKEAASTTVTAGYAAPGYAAPSTSATAGAYATPSVECLSSHACYPVNEDSNKEAAATEA